LQLKGDSLKENCDRTKSTNYWKMEMDPKGNWAIREDNLVGKMIHITTEEIQFLNYIKMPRMETSTNRQRLNFLKIQSRILY
jgi:hypothetical protein